MWPADFGDVAEKTKSYFNQRYLRHLRANFFIRDPPAVAALQFPPHKHPGLAAMQQRSF
jgi:hypothetical protein